MPAVVGGFGNSQREGVQGQPAPLIVAMTGSGALSASGTTSGTITHGSQLTRAMCLPRIGLTTMAGTVHASSFTGGVPITGIHFTGTFVPDVDCTLTDCQFDSPVDNEAGVIVQLNYCLVSPPTPGDWCIGPYRVSATRSALEGCSDGVRFDDMNLTEVWVRTMAQSAADHNDGLQAYQSGAGGSILRANIDGKPINGATYGIATGNSAIFIADSSQGTLELRDTWLSGGDYTLQLYESMHYRVTGVRIQEGTWNFGPFSDSAAVPGAFLEWSDNQTTGGTVLNP